MEKTLDLTKILKDAPIGTKLYSPIFGEVTFIGINLEHVHSIEVTDEYNECRTFDKEGKYFIRHCNAECVIFPSKDNRNWRTFNTKPKFDINTLKPFDKILGKDHITSKWRCDFFSHIINDNSYKFVCAARNYNKCIPYNDDTKHLVGTTEMPPEKYINWEE